MPTIEILTLQESNPEAYKIFRQCFEDVYLDNHCYSLALALREGLGWPLKGLKQKDGVIRHAFVQDPKDQHFWDARGRVSPEEIEYPFREDGPFELVDVSRQELTSSSKVTAESIMAARNRAEILWHDLSWEPGPTNDMIMFMTRLQQLSEEFGIWVSSFKPKSPPILYFDDGEDGPPHYKVQPTSDGLYWTAERAFKK